MRVGDLQMQEPQPLAPGLLVFSPETRTPGREKANPGSVEGAGEEARESTEGRHGGVRCGSYSPGDGLTDDGKRKDADDAEGAKNRHDVRKRDAFGHGDVGDGNVE